MKKILLLVVLGITICTSYGNTEENNFINRKTSNVIGFIPSEAIVINGWAIGWLMALDDFNYLNFQKNFVQINGLYTNLAPMQLFVAFGAVMKVPFALILNSKNYNYTTYDSVEIKNILNGVSIGLLERSEKFSVQGMQITGLSHEMGKLNGLSFATLASTCHYLNGVTITGIFNGINKGNGLQIGLINNAKELKGIQIGLWNKIGKRGLPLINFSFKKRK